MCHTVSLPQLSYLLLLLGLPLSRRLWPLNLKATFIKFVFCCLILMTARRVCLPIEHTVNWLFVLPDRPGSLQTWQLPMFEPNWTETGFVFVCNNCRMYIWCLVGWTRWRRSWSRRRLKVTKISACLSARSRHRQPSRTSFLREYSSHRSRSPMSRRLACMPTCTRHWATSTRFVCGVCTSAVCRLPPGNRFRFV